MAHRPEIDGLRSIAVLPVVFYHAGFAGFSGGFVGVDVFFVISGYLITQIIYADLSAGQFSLARFLERRARRILPALFLVLLVTTVFAWAWMLPRQLAEYGQSVLSVLTFLSNFYFWKTIDYFGTPADYLPLLHTWSLAVEEQFYLIFPLAMMGLVWAGLRRRGIGAVLAVVALASFAICLWAAPRSPSANFFFPVTRAWELLAGAGLALAVHRGLPRGHDGLAGAGLAMIAAAVWLLDHETPFPSAWALLPVLGTCLVLAFAQQGTWTGRVLSLRVPVAIGLVSYGAYLWHQPVFALARLTFPEPPSAGIMAALAVLSFALAGLSWTFLENPIRYKTGWIGQRSRSAALAGAVCLAALVSTAGAAIWTGGAPQRFTPAQQAILQDGNVFEDLLERYGRRGCFMNGNETVRVLIENDCLAAQNGPYAVLYGNSHAAHLIFGLSDLVQEARGVPVNMFVAASCRPWIEQDTSLRCRRAHQYFLEQMATRPPAQVYLAANWHPPYQDMGPGVFEGHIDQLVSALAQMGHSVTVVGRVPAMRGRAWQTQVAFGPDVPTNLEVASLDIAPVNAVLAQIAARNNARFFDPSRVLCPDGLDRCRVIDDGTVLYSDATHLSVPGSQRVVRALLEEEAAP